jgi:hypothetical protein
MNIYQEKSPAGGEALNIYSKENYSLSNQTKQFKKLNGDLILFEFSDECGDLKTGILDGRYKRLVKYLYSQGNNGTTVMDAVLSDYSLHYITQTIHLIRDKKGFGYKFITTDLEDIGDTYAPIARYRLTPSFKILAEKEA